MFCYELVTTVVFWALLYFPGMISELDDIVRKRTCVVCLPHVLQQPDVLAHSLTGAAAIMELVLNQITFGASFRPGCIVKPG
jgi:hypothetical protein